MNIENVPFCATDCNTVASERIEGERGFTVSKVVEQGNIRVRQVEYSADYKAENWCRKDHVLLILFGELSIEQADGVKVELEKGMSFQVADDNDAHRAHTENLKFVSSTIMSRFSFLSFSSWSVSGSFMV